MYLVGYPMNYPKYIENVSRNLYKIYLKSRYNKT